MITLSKEQRDFVKILKSIGAKEIDITHKKGKHPKLRCIINMVHIITPIASTPSCDKSFKNKLSEIKRMLKA